MPEPHRIWRPGQDAFISCTLSRRESGRDVVVEVAMIGGRRLNDASQLATAFGFLADQLAAHGINPVEVLLQRPKPLPGTQIVGGG